MISGSPRLIMSFDCLGLPVKAITSDDRDRILLCLRVLAEENKVLSNVFTRECRQSLALMLKEQSDYEAANTKAKKKKNVTVQAEDPIDFALLVSRLDMVNGDDMFESSLSKAVGMDVKRDDSDVSTFYYELTGIKYSTDSLAALVFIFEAQQSDATYWIF